MYSALWWFFWDPWPAGVDIGPLGHTVAVPQGQLREADPQGQVREARVIPHRGSEEA